MKRILYIPWTENQCKQIVNEANLWAESYSKRKFKVERTDELIDPKDTKALSDSASPKLFEVVIYDPGKKGQLAGLSKIDHPTDVHQLYILGHCSPKIEAYSIFPTDKVSHNTTGMPFLKLGTQLVDHENLPADFNGKVKLFMCRSALGPLADDLPDFRHLGSFAHGFTNWFIGQRPHAKVYGYTERIVSSYPTSKQIAFKAIWNEESNRIIVGAKRARVEFKKSEELKKTG